MTAQPAAASPGAASPPIRLLLADVDGTLVTPAKELTDQAVAAVRDLGQAGVLFALTSGRPPRGMEMLIEPLDVQTPIAAFNGGLMVDRELHTLEQHTLPAHLVEPVIELLASFALDAWIYRGADWYVRDPHAPHVDRESKTVQFPPTVRPDFAGLTDGVAKIVGIGDDHHAVSEAAKAAHDRFGEHVSAACSQPYYVDVTHPEANKGSVARYLADRYRLAAAEIATIGDMPNDVLMFAHSGLSIAMANADREVQRAARRVTSSNDDEGFARAVRRFILPRAAPYRPPPPA
ncbi:MAG TPA: Cof-type HAD-IIB family hydrolase [Solirubrobacteraceae bacterium]|nr:Cof-type HAD-IIB family hydrolase [Solirubrobacteraceae bacterium]